MGFFPVAPGATVGGGAIDIDDGWDRNVGAWIKNPGALTPIQWALLFGPSGTVNIGMVVYPQYPDPYNGKGNWGRDGKFIPSQGPESGKRNPIMSLDPTKL